MPFDCDAQVGSLCQGPGILVESLASVFADVVLVKVKESVLDMRIPKLRIRDGRLGRRSWRRLGHCDPRAGANPPSRPGGRCGIRCGRTRAHFFLARGLHIADAWLDGDGRRVRGRTLKSRL